MCARRLPGCGARGRRRASRTRIACARPPRSRPAPVTPGPGRQAVCGHLRILHCKIQNLCLLTGAGHAGAGAAGHLRVAGAADAVPLPRRHRRHRPGPRPPRHGLVRPAPASDRAGQTWHELVKHGKPGESWSGGSCLRRTGGSARRVRHRSNQEAAGRARYDAVQRRPMVKLWSD